MTFTLELSVDGVDDAVAAQHAGADRIELCAAGALGGLTPSAGVLAATLTRVQIPVHVLIRPRDGGFHHTPAEIDAMTADIRHARAAGATGVVLGALTPGRDPDEPALRTLLAAADGLDVTFHRAFDQCRDPFTALDTLAALGVTRILSSGQAATADAGAPLLARLVRAAGDRVEIMACGGIRPHNATAIQAATGARHLHAAPRVTPGPSADQSTVDYGTHAGLDTAAAHALATLAHA